MTLYPEKLNAVRQYFESHFPEYQVAAEKHFQNKDWVFRIEQGDTAFLVRITMEVFLLGNEQAVIDHLNSSGVLEHLDFGLYRLMVTPQGLSEWPEE